MGVLRGTVRKVIKSLLSPWVRSRLSGSWRTDPGYWVPRIVTSSSAQVVQIGSNDGQQSDPLHRLILQRPGWRALFVEPVPHLFSRLRANYGEADRFRFENAAVNDGEAQSFFWIDESAQNVLSDLPTWYEGLGSFSREHITKHLPELEPFIRESTVAGITLPDLLERHRITKIDILHIDTEGYDYRVLAQLDIEKHHPTVILFEHRHLSPDEYSRSIEFLREDYHLFKLPYDMLSVSKSRGWDADSIPRSLHQFRVDPAIQVFEEQDAKNEA